MENHFSGDLKRFLIHLRIERGLADNTIASYQQQLQRFHEYLRERHLHHLEIQTPHLLDFIKNISRQEKSIATQSHFISVLKSFYRYLYTNKQITVNPAGSLIFPKKWKTYPEYLTLPEVEKLLKSPVVTTPQGNRDSAMLEFLYSTGCRISELTGLQLEHVYLDESFVRILGKGGKERVVPFGETAKRALHRYLTGGRPKLLRNHRSNHLFLNRFGQPLSRQGAWKIMKKHAREVNLAAKVSPHTLRHSFATHMIENGADLRSIQMILGHASITTTEIYTHIARDQLRRIYDQFHPRG